jgi:ABC-type sugar transport system ATPase subunit
MNFFAGEKIEIDSISHVRCGLIDVRVPDGCQEAVKALPGANLTIAVRPQYIRILGDRGAQALPMTVFSVERLGKESIIIFDGPNGNKVRAIVEPGFQARVGDRLYVGFQSDQCLYFDSSSGRVIEPTARGV